MVSNLHHAMHQLEKKSTKRMIMKLLHKVKITETNPIFVLIVPSKNYKSVSSIWNITYMLIIENIYQKVWQMN